jgi:hypothetical protein
MIGKLAPKTFIRSGEGSIASYNYDDISSGTGVKIFYATCSQSQLSGAALISGAMLSTQAMGSWGTTGKFADDWTNFDLTPFNLPKTVRGIAYVEGWADRDTNDINLVLVFQKVSGGTATDISGYYNSIAATVDSLFLIAVPLTTTHFKKGDSLRVRMRKSGTGGGYVVDPSHTYYTTQSTLKFYVPFQLDL